MRTLISVIKKRYYNNSMHTNLFTVFLSLFVLITLPSTIALNIYQHTLNQEQIKDMSDSSLNVSYNNIIQTISGARKISTSMLSNDIIQDFLKSDSYTAQATVTLENTMYNLCSTSASQLSAYLYDFNGNYFYSDPSSRKSLVTGDITELDIFPQLKQQNGGLLCTNSKNIYTKTSGLSLVRIIRDLNTLKNLGILVINIPQNNLSSSFSESSADFSQGFILDQDMQNVFSSSTNSEDIFRSITKDAKLSDSFFYREHNQNYLLSYKQMKDYDLIIGTLRDTRQASLIKFTTNGGITIITVLNILLLWIGIFIVSRSVTKPIILLSSKMSRISEKKFPKIQTEFSSKNEIGQLVDCYNEMVLEIQQLLAKEVNAEKHRRHLELNLLQTQIKPHFLYNTIDHARMLCISGEAGKANKLMQAMGTYYKTIFSKGKTTITIEDEVNTIRQYEAILAIGEETNYKIVYHIDEQLSGKYILKFILQPLVENCIKHGLYGVDDGIITVTFFLKDGDILFISVSDNGRGMEPELASEILKHSYHSSSKSFGLAATIERLRLCYEEDCLINIEHLNPGTAIIFQIYNFSKYSSKLN